MPNHFGMIPAAAQYCKSWRRGHRFAPLANYTGLWIGDRSRELRKEIAKATVLGKIVNLYSVVPKTVKAPEAGLVFGLRHWPQVRVSNWISMALSTRCGTTGCQRISWQSSFRPRATRLGQEQAKSQKIAMPDWCGPRCRALCPVIGRCWLYHERLL